ncbi:MAG: hypothetical protein SOW18_04995 [Peptoniphilus sp.]|nr:hypothetical protein [Peptoniphilus sp.]MDY3118880.1 hypothetical protein [Peptoniphilus sp.]
MNRLILLVIFGIFIFVKSVKRRGVSMQKEKRDSVDGYEDLPMEVQKAIKAFPPSKVEEGKKETQAQLKERLEKKHKKDLAKKEIVSKTNPSRERVDVDGASPFQGIESFDEAYRPWIYSEVVSEPKCKRKKRRRFCKIN